MKLNDEIEHGNRTLMTPKNNKFHVWKKIFLSFPKQRLKDVVIKNAGKKKLKKIWIRLNLINKILLALPKSWQKKILLLVFLHKINQVINVLLKLLPKSKIYSIYIFCLGPLVWIQFILLILRFFHTIGLAAVNYEMVDSAVLKKPSKAPGTYKVYSDKDRFSIGKNARIYGTTSTVRRWENIYPL